MSESDDCLFCKIIAGQIPSSKVYEDETTYAFNDINPKAKVHVLVVPKKHYANVAELAAGDPTELAHIVSIAQNIADKEFHGATDWCSTPVLTPARPSSTCTRT